MTTSSARRTDGSRVAVGWTRTDDMQDLRAPMAWGHPAPFSTGSRFRIPTPEENSGWQSGEVVRESVLSSRFVAGAGSWVATRQDEMKRRNWRRWVMVTEDMKGPEVRTNGL